MAMSSLDVHTQIFTPQEYPVEILEVARQNDIVACCLPSASKQFVAFMLFKEFYYRNDGLSVFLQEDDDASESNCKAQSGTKKYYTQIPFDHLSNIPVIRITDTEEIPAKLFEPSFKSAVVICSIGTFLRICQARQETSDWGPKLSLIVFDNAHRALKDLQYSEKLQKVLNFIRSHSSQKVAGPCYRKPRIVFLTVSLLQYYQNQSTGFWRMEESFTKLQKLTGAIVDTCSNVTALLRYSVSPIEKVFQYEECWVDRHSKELYEEISSILKETKAFIESHHYDPISEFGGIGPPEPGDEIENENGDVDSLAEELKRIPDPRAEPLKILSMVKNALEEFGLWCMDRALMLLAARVEELRVATPYERHYLVLGVLFTTLNSVHLKCQTTFKQFSPLETLAKFSTPKLRALVNVIRRYDLSNPWESKRNGVDAEPDASEVMSQSKNGNITVDKAKTRGNKKKKIKSVDSPQTSSEKAISNTTLQAADGLNACKPEEECGEAKKSLAEKTSTGLRPDRRSYKNRPKRNKNNQRHEESTLCGLIVVEDRFCAKLIYHYIHEVALCDSTLVGLRPVIALPLSNQYGDDTDEAEREYKRREEALRRFRYKEANVLIGTTLLQEGIELPKANLVVRFDPPLTFRSYLFSKGRAQGHDAEYYIFTPSGELNRYLEQMSVYKLVEEMLLTYSVIPKPINSRFPEEGEKMWVSMIPKFKGADIVNAVEIVNRYCARLPSDTFTRLTPLWKLSICNAADDEDDEKSAEDSEKRFSCNLRLPINSPIKWQITGVPMPTFVLAKRAVALQTVVVLHANGEIDDALLPIGKEGVKQEPDLDVGAESPEEEYGEFRPGSTKRRQYYDKKVAPELTLCMPKPESRVYLYWVRMTLNCPLPEEQNTRGRKLHPPELAPQCFGFITRNSLPCIPPFLIYTRCGEVKVEIVPVDSDSNFMDESRLAKVAAFHHYTFTSVLRLHKYLTLFDPDSAESSFMIVPLKPTSCDAATSAINSVQIDWEFISEICHVKDATKKSFVADEDRKSFKFSHEAFADAVVMPWYRSNDQPQYFYVAEICQKLTPRSQFPGCEFKTFEEYYSRKYSISIQDPDQPLLDVDHTSVRLNFLTPRYVNRKGMALPTSSETTKRAKRENLEQKQILIPELCTIHPFSASLWRQAVSLPCILYRMNCLLLANNVRVVVAEQIVGLGNLDIKPQWEPLSFGWAMIETFETEETQEAVNQPEPGDPNVLPAEEPVLQEENDPQEEHVNEETQEPELEGFAKAAKEELGPGITLAESLLMNDNFGGKSANEILAEKLKTLRPPEVIIDTWSNELAAKVENDAESEAEFEDELDFDDDPNFAFPSNLSMISKNWTWGGKSRLFNHRHLRALYGSPTHWGEVWDEGAFVPVEDTDEGSLNHDFNDNDSIASDGSGSTGSFLDEDNNLKVQFINAHTAETLDKRKLDTAFDNAPIDDECMLTESMWWEEADNFVEDEIVAQGQFDEQVKRKVANLWNLVCDDILKMPKRALIAPVSCTSMEESPNPHYEALLKLMTPTTPPSMYPLSAEAIKRMENLKNQQKSRDGAFSFDYQPKLSSHTGPSPCVLLQALTMSNANDGLNLERLETIGDSFLKYAITTYLFCTFENIHEGKLSHLRSRQVSNVHLYRLGKQRGLGCLMVSAKFEPHDNWLPPGYHIPKGIDKALIQSKLPKFSMAQVNALKDLSENEMEVALKSNSLKIDSEFVPYNLVTQQSIPDKSIADCVEALIGAYLTATGPRGALLFMSWLGMRVLPSKEMTLPELQSRVEANEDVVYMRLPKQDKVLLFEELKPPNSPLLRYSKDSEEQLCVLLKGYEDFERAIGYTFRDRSYLLQAFTHASYYCNTLTDCYQRLEFLGDAILDYLITRHLYEDPRQHSPGSLTDLRSALVNNTIFASLAVKNNFHKFFRHSSPGLSDVLQKFVAFQEQHGHTLTQDYYLMDEEECEEAEDIEVPKALGDVFESVAGAIYLDSGMSLDAVWDVYFRIMKNEIEQFSQNVPKSPIRELLELEPETAKFGKPEKLWDGRRVRVSVDIIEVGTFRGIGRNYRIAKCTAAKCALRHLRKLRSRNRR